MKRFFISVFFIFLVLNCYCATVDIFITQNDGVQENVRDITSLFEATVMDTFFDYGHIVSNEPVSLDLNTKSSCQKAYDNAQKGFSDFLITFMLNVDPVTESVVSVNYEVINVLNDKIIKKADLSVPKAVSLNRDDIEITLIVFIKKMLTQINQSLFGV
jgi:hypothetical protein